MERMMKFTVIFFFLFSLGFMSCRDKDKVCEVERIKVKKSHNSGNCGGYDHHQIVDTVKSDTSDDVEPVVTSNLEDLQDRIDKTRKLLNGKYAESGEKAKRNRSNNTYLWYKYCPTIDEARGVEIGAGREYEPEPLDGRVYKKISCEEL